MGDRDLGASGNNRKWRGLDHCCATDTPLSAVQLAGRSRRATVGIARTGTCGLHDSGDIFLAFSTECSDASEGLPDTSLSTFFEAAAAAVEEAILNALVGAETLAGFQGHVLEGIDHDAIAHHAHAHLALFQPGGPT